MTSPESSTTVAEERVTAEVKAPRPGREFIGRKFLPWVMKGGLAIVDYKTGAPPSQRAVEEGFALQLGLLGLIARASGFPEVSGEPRVHEYWSLARRLLDKNPISPAKAMSAEDFLAHAYRNFVQAAEKWLTGSEPFTAKLNPAYAPYGDYDQLMRLEEWYGRE